MHITLMVRDYDEAIELYVNKLKFELIDDTYQTEQDERWIVISLPDSNGVSLLLARVSKPTQNDLIGNQTDG